VCIKLIPVSILNSLSREDVNLLCLFLKLKPKQISFVLNMPVSTVYRRLERLSKMGFGEPCIYLPISTEDGTIKLLRRPILVLTEEHCVYIPERCESDCLNCPYYSVHLNGLSKLGVIDGLYATPQEWADALVEKVKRRLAGGFRLD
jgi:hypothetical protein